MNKEIISSSTAPGAVGPYSQGVRSNGFLFLSGQIALDPATGKLVGDTAQCQAEQVCKNIMALLASQGLTAESVVKTTVFITDIQTFAHVNEVYAKYFTAPCPARSCVEVGKLPLGALVEIEVIAAL